MGSLRADFFKNFIYLSASYIFIQSHCSWCLLWLSLQTLEAVFLICRTLNYMAMIFYRNGYRKLRGIRSRTQQKEKAMLKFFEQRIRNIRAGKKDQYRMELPVWLGKEAHKSIERLKVKMPKTNEDKLVTVSLKLLEQRWDIIVKRRARKKSRTLKKEGMNSQQIAEQLNKENFPSPMGSDQWHGDLIPKLWKG